MANVKGVDQLKEHLERAKEHLSSTNETIKKYTGREPGAQRPGFRQFDTEAAGRRILSNALKRGISSANDDGPVIKSSRRGNTGGDVASNVIGVAYSRLETRRRERDVYGRLGPAPRSALSRLDDDRMRDRDRDRDRDWDRDRDRDRRREPIRYRESKEEEIKARVRRLDEMGDDDEERKAQTRRRPITISSSITRQVDDEKFDNDEVKTDTRKFQTTSSVVRVPEQRSREDAINEMNSVNAPDKERNRRIFSGLLLNTLRNFNTQATRAEEVAKRRRNVEARIEEREAEEKEDLRRERADLFRARRDNQRMVRRIEQKIRSVDAFEAWKKEFEKQKFFIRTRARPHIYYLPRLMDSTCERRLARTAKEVDSQIAERRAKMEEEVAQLIEEEPQDPNQLLEETNRSRLQQGRDGDNSNPSAAEGSNSALQPQSGTAQPDFDDLGSSSLQEPTVAEEENPRLEETVYVGEEEDNEPDAPTTDGKDATDEVKAGGAAEPSANRKGALDDVSQMQVVEVNIADEDIPLPPSPGPPPKSIMETDCDEEAKGKDEEQSAKTSRKDLAKEESKSRRG